MCLSSSLVGADRKPVPRQAEKRRRHNEIRQLFRARHVAGASFIAHPISFGSNRPLREVSVDLFRQSVLWMAAPDDLGDVQCAVDEFVAKVHAPAAAASRNPAEPIER